MLYAESGQTYVGRDPTWGKKMADKYTALRYHKVGDEYDSTWDLSGAVEDVNLYIAVGQKLANEITWPSWYQGNEFKSIRDRSAAARE